MEKASDSYEGPRRINNLPLESEDEQENESVVLDQSADPIVLEQNENQPDRFSSPENTVLGLSIGGGRVSSSQYEALDSYKLYYGTANARNELLLMLAYQDLTINPQDKLVNSVDGGLNLFSIGLRYNQFFKRRLSIAPYWLAGAGISTMLWRYRNGIILGNGSTIYYDSLAALEVLVGIGADIKLSENLFLSAELMPRFFLWGDSTSEGFNNDVFENVFTYTGQATIKFNY